VASSAAAAAPALRLGFIAVVGSRLGESGLLLGGGPAA
jgi:hypothetical protein